MTGRSALSVDELADGICLRAGRITAAQAELLLWIAEFDRREGWGGPGHALVRPLAVLARRHVPRDGS
jgi:hypothetical protein